MQIEKLIRVDNGKAFFGDFNQFNDKGIDTIQNPLTKILARIFGIAVLCKDIEGHSAVFKKSELKNWLEDHGSYQIASSEINRVTSKVAEILNSEAKSLKSSLETWQIPFLSTDKFEEVTKDFKALNSNTKHAIYTYLNQYKDDFSNIRLNIDHKIEQCKKKGQTIQHLKDKLKELSAKEEAYQKFLADHPLPLD